MKRDRIVHEATARLVSGDHSTIDTITDEAIDALIALADSPQELALDIANRRSTLHLESEVSEIIDVCKNILGFGIAGLAVAIPLLADSSSRVPHFLLKLGAAVCISYALMVFTSIVVLFIHTLQSRFRYPF